MGINGLWAYLKSRDCVESIEGEELAVAVDGKIIAIDASIWIVLSQTELSYKHERRHLRIVFDRLNHYLRLGVLPILVFDGVAPPEKATRCGGNVKFQRMMEEIQTLLGLLGLPFVKARGEAEAACAHLNRLGKVDAVASSDGDALLFGARFMYKDLRLHVDLDGGSGGDEKEQGKEAEAKPKPKPKRHHSEWVDRAAAAATLGLEERDFEEAMTVVALLSGGDYLKKGVFNFGPAMAVEVAQALLRKQRQRQAEGGGSGGGGGGGAELQLLNLLREVVSTPVDEALLAGKSACSTCRRCRHGTVKKTEHGPQGCSECGTHAKGGNGAGGCNEAPNPDEPCPCEPCCRKDDRLLHSLAKAAAGVSMQRFDAACEAYKRGLNDEAAEEAAPFIWGRRPNYDKLRHLVEAIYGRNAPRKLLPLIFEYDARFVGRTVGADMAVFGPADLDAAEMAGFMLAPTAILRPCGRSGGRTGRWEMRILPMGEGVRVVAEAAALKGLEMPQPPPQRCSAQEKDAYRNALAEVVKKVMSEGRNTLRMSLVKSQYGALEAAYQAELERKRQPPPKPKKGKAAVSRTAAGGTRPGPMDKFVLRCLAGATGAASSASASSSSSAASSSSSAASSPPSSGGAGAFAAAAGAAAAAAASAPFTPTKAPRPALRTPSAPKKGKRPMLLTSDGEDEEDDEDFFGSGVRDLNMLFSKRPRLGASDDEGEGDEGGDGESSIIDLCTSLSSVAEEAGGGGRAEAVVEAVVVEVDDEVEIVEEDSSLARVGSPRAARGRRRRDRCRTPDGMETVDLTKS